VTWIAASKISMGLYHTRSLRNLRFIVPSFAAIDEGIWYLMFAQMLFGNSPIEILECGCASAPLDVPSFQYPLLEAVCEKWVEKFETKNETLHFIGGSLLTRCKAAEDIQYYLDLNKCQARRVVREPKTTTEEWLRSIGRASEENKLNAVYYLIRNKPECCKWQ
jgi:hypothetical protein